jgi:hypothetical protein
MLSNNLGSQCSSYSFTLPDNEDLTFKVHSHKLATLIALSCLLRLSEIAAISLAFVNFSTSAATLPQKVNLLLILATTP